MDRYLEELERMQEWDADALVDTLDITSEELLEVTVFRHRALDWIKENISG